MVRIYICDRCHNKKREMKDGYSFRIEVFKYIPVYKKEPRKFGYIGSVSLKCHLCDECMKELLEELEQFVKKWLER